VAGADDDLTSLHAFCESGKIPTLLNKSIAKYTAGNSAGPVRISQQLKTGSSDEALKRGGKFSSAKASTAHGSLFTP